MRLKLRIDGGHDLLTKVPCHEVKVLTGEIDFGFGCGAAVAAQCERDIFRSAAAFQAVKKDIARIHTEMRAREMNPDEETAAATDDGGIEESA